MSIRNKYNQVRKTAFVFVVIMLADIVLPTVAHAITSGPSQPEVQSFEPVGTTQMVDLFSGDFTYNIPIFELPGPDGGYPFNLAYHSGIGMDQEASWCGLGWNINPGAITRQKRGIPDDFNGDPITKTVDMKPNVTIGLGTATPSFEFAGKETPSFIANNPIGGGARLSIYHNNYIGLGVKTSASLTTTFTSESGIGMGMGLNIGKDSQTGGTSITPTFSLKYGVKENGATTVGAGVDFSLTYNSRMGLTDIGLGMNVFAQTSKDVTEIPKPENSLTGEDPPSCLPKFDVIGDVQSFSDGGTPKSSAKKLLSASASSQMSFSTMAAEYTPFTPNKMTGSNLNISAKFGVGNQLSYIMYEIFGYYNVHKLAHKNEPVPTPAYGFLNMNNALSEGNHKTFAHLLDFNREMDGIISQNTPILPIPVVNNDIYNMTGQGVAGQFKAYSSEVNILRDKTENSTINGGSIGFEIGPGFLGHLGLSGGIY